jgi:hypothetical protein
MFRQKLVPDLIRDGHRFAEKNIRRSIDLEPYLTQLDRMWL